MSFDLNFRLMKKDIPALCRLSMQPDFPYPIDKETALTYCSGGTVQTYGIRYGTDLISVMTATFCMVFPSKDSPSGKIVQISGAYTRPDFRGKGYATKLLERIEQNAIAFGADYLCLDSTADELYLKNGFVAAPDSESRLWKRLSKPDMEV